MKSLPHSYSVRASPRPRVALADCSREQMALRIEMLPSCESVDSATLSLPHLC